MSYFQTFQPSPMLAPYVTVGPNDKPPYQLDEITRKGEVINIRLKYLQGAQTEKLKDEFVIRRTKVGAAGRS